MRGSKWLESCTYLTADDKAKVHAVAAQCKRAFPAEARTVGIRCPSYTGEPHPIAVIDYGPGRRIYSHVYRDEGSE